MAAPEVELNLTSASDNLPIRNLYPLYLHDIASYEHKPPNRHGVLHADGSVETWDEVLATQAPWWKNPELLFPYLIRVGGTPAGFSWVAAGPFVPVQDAEFTIYEYFVVHAWRGTKVATEGVRQSLERHRGTWFVATWTTAQRAQAFWRRVLPTCAKGPVRETIEQLEWGERVVFRFEN